MEKSSSSECMEESNTNIELHSPNPTTLKEIEVDEDEDDLHFSNKNDGFLQFASSEETNCQKHADKDESASLLTNKTELRVTESNGRQHRSALLSNKERLLLRKQALKTTKRPVLAVGKFQNFLLILYKIVLLLLFIFYNAGRSNIVSGVAKTIKTHFQKHPLAIVNIKGRAKGTSVQQLVSKLEVYTNSNYF